MPDHEECYRRIQESITVDMNIFYQEHPDLLFDERSRAAVKQTHTGLEHIMAILEDYVITRKTLTRSDEK